LLLVVSAAGCASAQKRGPEQGLEAPAAVHVVEKGDTVFGIARRYGVSVEALSRENQLADPGRLELGRRLRIPGPARDPLAAVAGPKSEPDAGGGGPRPEPARVPTADAPTSDAPAVPRANAASTASAPVEPGAPVSPVNHPELASAPRAAEPPLSRAPKPSRAGMIWPVDGVVISAFGNREGGRHDGIDIAAPFGTPIWAALPGKVLFAGEQPGYGLLVIVGHTGELVTIYAHNASNLVAEGDQVEQGDPIARVGQSGEATTPALHFEVRTGRQPINPFARLPE
jgi:murein DD-endopeptidase MepM/ murein hydrolase activator NlpD